MLDYTGIKCPVCGVPFRSGDDIVVCPECGAPYHRACYQEKGACVFEDLHKEGKAWEPPAPPEAPDPRTEIKDRECPVCGTLNGHSALFCNRCGASLTGEPQQHRNAGPRGQEGPAPGVGFGGGVPPASTGFGGVVPPFAFDPMGGVSPAEVLDTGVTFGDASKLVKQNTAYYMPVFRYMKQTGKNKFNFTAFLFSGPWMLFRKQYKAGAVVTALMFSLYLALQGTLYFVWLPLYTTLAQQAGVDFTTQGMVAMTYEQQMAFAALLAAEGPLALFQFYLPVILAACMLAVMVVVGFKANKMYMRHCIRTVRQVKGSGGDGDPANTLDARGGVNTSIAVCMAVCYMILQMIPMWLP